MGKIIKKTIKGMSFRAKISIILTLTLLFSVFMYQGWYKPKMSQAADKVIIITSGASWTVPADWSSTNSIEVIGGGGGGGSSAQGSAGGGGGAYAKVTNVNGLSGTVTINVGTGGGDSLAGTATWFNGAGCATSSVCGDFGIGATNNTAGTGGTTTNSVGTLLYAGGNGGIGNTSGDTGAGGGGAAGPSGAGKSGGNGNATSASGGGGGSNGGSSAVGGNASTSTGGNGGNGFGGTGGPAGTVNAGTNATTGTGAGGSGAGATTVTPGGNGAMQVVWTATDLTTAGSGGGGGGAGNNGTGGNAGGYGGGGGGGETAGGSGTGGVIVITYTPLVDTTPPTVSSIVRVNTSPTNATSVQYTVTFSESVTGVNAADFTLTTTGVSGASVTNVAGSGMAWTVTVGTGSGSGTIRLNVTDDDTIVDAAANALGGTGAGNGNYTSGEVYTIDKAAPTVSSTVPTSGATGVVTNSSVTINWSENVNCGTVTTGNITMSAGGWALSSCSGTQAIFTTSGQAASTSYTITVGTGVTDTAGNPMAASYPFSYTSAAGAVNATTVGAMSFPTVTSSSIIVQSAYTGDSDNNNTCIIAWGTDGSTYPNSLATTKGAGYYTATASGLNPSTTYYFRATYTDGTGLSGSPSTGSQATLAAASSPLLHNSANVGTKYGTWGTTYTCSTCHLSSTTNLKRIKTAIVTPIGNRPVVFTAITATSSTAASMGNDNRTAFQEASRNICEVCHHNTTFHQYSASKVAVKTHENNKDCMSCHAHYVAFKAGCDSCHGNPPTSLATLVTKPEATLALNGNVGSHASHVTSEGMTCTVCHSGNTMPTVSKTIQMGFDINNSTWPGFAGTAAFGSFSGHSPLGGSPAYTFVSSKAGTVVNTSTSYRTSCNVYCHGQWAGANGSINPSWIITDGSQSACGTCHAATAANPPATGKHTTHASSSAGNYGFSCTKCHPNAGSGFNHVNGSVQWRLSSSTNGLIGSTATYTPFGGSAAISGSTTGIAPSATYGTCNNIYCHSTVQNNLGTGAPTYKSVGWSDAALACSGCHGNDAATLTTGSHATHLSTTTHAAITCANCHSGYETATPPNHVNKVINVQQSAILSSTGTYTDSAGAPGNGYGTCGTSYCHSNVQSATGGARVAGDYKTVTWGSGAMTCASCHGNTAATLVTGTHAKHLNVTYGYSCAACHGTTGGAGNTAIHANQTINIDLTTKGASATYSGDGTPANSNFGTCTATICHGRNSGAWGASVSTQLCTECHGQANTVYANFSSSIIAPGGAGVDTGGNTAATSARVGAHQTHLLASSGISDKMHCGECHTVHTTIQDGTHLNYTTSTVSFGPLAKAQSHTTAAVTRVSGIINCSATYCHTATTNTGTGLTPVWNNDTYLTATANLVMADCKKCHNMPPNPGVAGDHSTVAAALTAFPVAAGTCSCHSNLVTGVTTVAGIFTDKFKHVNGTVDVDGGHAKPYYATDAGHTGCLSGIGCHANSAPTAVYPAGGTPNCRACHQKADPTVATNGCGSCHGAANGTGEPSGTVHPDAAGSHPKHTVLTLATCAYCHTGGGTGTNANHGQSSAGTNIVDITAGQGWSATTCTTSYCHSTGQSTNGAAPGTNNTSPVWGTGATTCGSCHLNFDSNASATGDHVAHAQTNNIACAACHNGYTETTAASATHTNQNIDLSFSGTLATGTTYSQGNIHAVANGYGTCSTSYCHSTGQSTTGGATPVYPATAPTWGTTAMTCGSCHLDFNSNASATGDHVKHAQGTANFACVTCHTGYTETTVNTATHVNKTIEVAITGTYAGGTYTGGTTSGNHAAGGGFGSCSATKCHGQGAPVWGGALYNASVPCENCHGSATTNPFYSTAATGAAPTKTTLATDSKVGAHTAHLTAGTISSPIACAECHPSVTAITTPATHMDGSSTFTWGTLAKTGALSPSIVTGTCSNNYCHGAAMPGGDTAGSDETPLWTDTAYLSATLDVATCGKCHGFPPLAASGHPNVTAPTGFPTTSCNCHSNMSGTGNSYANIFVDKTKHINGIYEPSAGGDCLGCHSALVAADFVRPSRHVSNGTTTSIVTNFDCIVCHAEGDTTSSGTSISMTALHSMNSTDPVDLRNVDSSANPGTANTNYWAWPGRRGTPLAKGSANTLSRDRMDSFCMGCHDANGSSTIAVNNSNSGLIVGAAAVSTVRTVTGTGNTNTNSANLAQRPFNTNDKLQNTRDTALAGNGTTHGTFRLTTYGRVLNVKSQFNSGGAAGTAWASHHNLNQFVKRYTSNNTTAGTGLPTGVWTAYVNKEGFTLNGTGNGTGANAGLHCSDCHLNEVNAHGSVNSWYMLAGSATASDTDIAPTTSGTSTTTSETSCFRCHDALDYAEGGGGTEGRVDHSGRCNNIDVVTGTAVEAPFGNNCHACHGGYGNTALAVNQDVVGTGSTLRGRGALGAIHGNNETYRPGGATVDSPRYRFTSGASMRFWNPSNTATANWAATTGGTCYTLSAADQWGSCTKHGGGAGQTINKGRALSY